jgi:hypothetical protein
VGFLSPKPPQPPQESEEAKRLRDQEQQRAEAERIKATSENLQARTQLSDPGAGIASLRKVFGRRGLTSLLGSG